MQKILLITDVTAPGGVDTYLCSLAIAAREKGIRVSVLMDRLSGSDRVPGSDRLHEMLQKAGIPVQRAGLYHRKFSEEVRREATQKVLAEFAPDLVHAVCGAPWTTVVPREVVLDAGIPLIFTEQYVAPGFTFAPELHERIVDIYQRSKFAIAVSENNTHLLAEEYGFPNDRLQVIPNSVQTNDSSSLTLEKVKEVRENLCLPVGKTQAVVVSRLDQQKGLDILLQALAFIPAATREMLFVTIFGDGPDQLLLQQQAEDLDLSSTVCFYGWHSDAASLLPAFDLFLLPSRAEGQPFSLLEALAAGGPVIASDASGISEVLDHGKGGELFPSENPQALGRAIEKFLDDPGSLREKALYGRRFVEANYDQKKNLKKTMDLWDEALREK